MTRRRRAQHLAACGVRPGVFAVSIESLSTGSGEKNFACLRFPLAPDGEFWFCNVATRWTGYSGGYAQSDANNAHNAFESVEQFK